MSNDSGLQRKGLLFSLQDNAILEIFYIIEEEHDVRVEVEEMTPVSLGSVERVMSYVQRKQSPAGLL